MTDRYPAFLVTLYQDMRSDDADKTLSALQQVKGVLSVEPVTADPILMQVVKSRRDIEWHDALHRVMMDGPEIGDD